MLLLERGIRRGRPESVELFALALCNCLGPLAQKWCDQGFRVDIDGNPWQLGHARGRPLPGSWSCLETDKGALQTLY